MPTCLPPCPGHPPIDAPLAMVHRIRKAQSLLQVAREQRRKDDVRLAMERRVGRITWAHVVYPAHGNVGRVRERRAGGWLASCAPFRSCVRLGDGWLAARAVHRCPSDGWSATGGILAMGPWNESGLILAEEM